MGYGYGNGVKGDEKPTVIEEGGITQVISKDGATAEQIELEPTFGQKLKNHFRRFWWVHLIIFICCFLIIIFPVVYVGYPRIAQKGVSGSGLTVNKLNLSEPYSDSCHIELDQVLTVNSPFKPKLFEFAANLSLPGRGHDNPFMRVTVPEAIAQNGQKVNVNQYTDIPVEEFTRYTTTVTLNEEFEVIVYGRPKLQQGKLPKVTVTYNTTTKMKGLNKLKGFALENMTMDLSGAHGKRDDSGSGIMDLLGSFLGGSSNSSSSEDSSSGGDKQGLLVTMAKKMLNFDVPFTAIAAIPNPTVMTLYLGNVTTWPMFNGSAIGRSIIHDLILHPGNHNRYNVTGTMNIAQALPALHGTKMNIQILSNESIWHGRNLTYFGDALATNLMDYQVDLSEVLKNSLPGMGSLLK